MSVLYCIAVKWSEASEECLRRSELGWFKGIARKIHENITQIYICIALSMHEYVQIAGKKTSFRVSWFLKHHGLLPQFIQKLLDLPQ